MALVPAATFLPRFRSRGLGVLRDDAHPSGRAVLVAPAGEITAELVNELVTLTGGLLFCAVTEVRADALRLAPMSREAGRSNTAAPGDGALKLFVSVEAREGVTTGISAADRARTLNLIGSSEPNPRSLVQPGHIFPVPARAGGVLLRQALPEGAVDLVSAAGFSDAAAFIDLLSPAGALLPPADQDLLAAAHNLPLTSLSEVTRYRLESEHLVYRVAEAKLPTRYAGELRSCLYRSTVLEGEHLALIKGEIPTDRPVLTRVQAEFTCTDVFGGSHPPTRQQLHGALAEIGREGAGVLVYLRRSRSGELREQVSAGEMAGDSRHASLMRGYGLGAQILRDLGVRRIELLTGSRKDLAGLTTFGIEIVSQRPLPRGAAGVER